MRRPQFSHKRPTGPDWIPSARPGYFFVCPDIDAIDEHLAWLVSVTMSGNLKPSTQVLHWRDQDTLLDLRNGLRSIDSINLTLETV